MKIKTEFDETGKAIAEKQKMYIENAKKNASAGTGKGKPKFKGEAGALTSYEEEHKFKIGIGEQTLKLNRRQINGKSMMRPILREISFDKDKMISSKLKG